MKQRQTGLRPIIQQGRGYHGETVNAFEKVPRRLILFQCIHSDQASFVVDATVSCCQSETNILWNDLDDQADR